MINCCRVLFAATLYCGYPLDLFVARDVLTRSVFPRTHCRSPRLVHTALTLALVCLTTAVALAYEDLGRVLELTGGVSATALAFIFPAAAFLRLNPLASSFSRTAAAALMAFGGAVMLVVLCTTVSSLILPAK